MASTTTRLLTFAEFQTIPEPPGGRYELHHGELVKVGHPKLSHIEIQHRIYRLLEAAAGKIGIVRIEFPYRPLPEHEGWRADVVYISKARWEKRGEDYFGGPDLVIEVLSPSNRAEDLIEKKDLCLENGSSEFWIVNPKRRQVEVLTSGGRTITYKSGQQIPLLFGGKVGVDAIFFE